MISHRHGAHDIVPSFEIIRGLRNINVVAAPRSPSCDADVKRKNGSWTIYAVVTANCGCHWSYHAPTYDIVPCSSLLLSRHTIWIEQGACWHQMLLLQPFCRRCCHCATRHFNIVCLHSIFEGWNGNAVPCCICTRQMSTLNQNDRWKTCSVVIWSQLMSTTHCDYNAACVWLTFPHDTGHWIDHQGELPCVFSVSLTYMMYKEDDIDMGQTSNQVHMSLWIMTARKLWMSYDRGGWGLILQCNECM